jgi:hypothetical protein
MLLYIKQINSIIMRISRYWKWSLRFIDFISISRHLLNLIKWILFSLTNFVSLIDIYDKNQWWHLFCSINLKEKQLNY